MYTLLHGTDKIVSYTVNLDVTRSSYVMAAFTVQALICCLLVKTVNINVLFVIVNNKTIQISKCESISINILL